PRLDTTARWWACPRSKWIPACAGMTKGGSGALRNAITLANDLTFRHSGDGLHTSSHRRRPVSTLLFAIPPKIKMDPGLRRDDEWGERRPSLARHIGEQPTSSHRWRPSKPRHTGEGRCPFGFSPSRQRSKWIPACAGMTKGGSAGP